MTETLEQIEEQAFTDLEREHYEDIQYQEQECAKLEDAFEVDKATASASKKRWEESVAKLRSLIRRGPDDQKKLDFPDDWRATAIGEAITLTDSQAEKLTEAGVSTVEEFENLRAGQNKDYPNGLSDLPRVGEATITKWEDEIVDWMSQNSVTDEDQDVEGTDDED